MNHFSAPRSSARTSGFTLVELLVVIGIIAILAAVILSAGTAAINASKRVKTSNMCTQIQTAVSNYYTEYSVYPVPAGVTADYILKDDDTAVTASGTSWGPLIECLSGMISPTTGLLSTEAVFTNTRSISYLTLKASDVGNGTTTGHTDAPLNSLQPNATQLYLNIAVDADYDGILGAAPSATASLMPKFSPVVPTGFPSASAGNGGGTSTAGVALWANCNPNSYSNSNFWVHTY